MFESLRKNFQAVVEAERDGIINNLDEFVSSEVQNRLDNARESVANVWGTGTTIRQGNEVSSFSDTVRSLLARALREHFEARIREFASAVHKTAESVAPRIREASEGVLRQRLEAIESSLQVAAEGQKEHVESYLGEMLGLVVNFAAEPSVATPKGGFIGCNKWRSGATITHIEAKLRPMELVEQHYEISEGATGYTYERILRPYIDTAVEIEVDDPVVRLPNQMDNFTRFCALAVRLGKVVEIRLSTGLQPGESTDDVDSRLETLRRDLHSLMAFLVSPGAKWLTGRSVRIDGGEIKGI